MQLKDYLQKTNKNANKNLATKKNSTYIYGEKKNTDLLFYRSWSMYLNMYKYIRK